MTTALQLPARVIRTYAESRKAKHGPGVFFRCSDCGETKTTDHGYTTGYGVFGDKRRRLVCFDCCGKRDAREMTETGRAVLYLSGRTVCNWPGTLKMDAYHVREGRHNIARRRLDAWFTGPDGARWHGVNIGDNQILRCKRMKGSVS